MPGHVFVVGADLTALACDDVLVPTDRKLRVSPSWLSLLPDEVVGEHDDEGACLNLHWPGESRVLPVEACRNPRVWLVDTVGEEGRGLPWLLDGAREALAMVAKAEVDEPSHGRVRRVVGLPALGTGWGVAAGERGELLEQLLPVLGEAATEDDFDVALVLRDRSDLAAAQRIRRSGVGSWDLPDELQSLARRLGERALAGELAVFVGAGVSTAAGLPNWSGIVEELAERAELPEQLRRGLAALPPQDSAALLARELGEDGLAAYLEERFGEQPYALAHAALAALPANEYVTTNYDPLLELAARGAGQPLRVLPFDEPRPDQPWLLKLHGDALRPGSVVLTREQYLSTGDHRAALAGVLHGLLLTRHVLFVGSSMLDDDLVRIAHEVRRALRVPGGQANRRTGTVLTLREDPARARLWSADVDTVAMADADTPPAEAARRLEVFLDLLGCLSCPPRGYLLDPAYRGMLDESESALVKLLARLQEDADDTARSASGWDEVSGLLRALGGRSEADD